MDGGNQIEQLIVVQYGLDTKEELTSTPEKVKMSVAHLYLKEASFCNPRCRSSTSLESRKMSICSVSSERSDTSLGSDSEISIERTASNLSK